MPVVSHPIGSESSEALKARWAVLVKVHEPAAKAYIAGKVSHAASEFLKEHGYSALGAAPRRKIPGL